MPTQLVASLRTEDDEGNQWSAARSRRGPLRGGGVALLVKEGLALLLRLVDGRPKARPTPNPTPNPNPNPHRSP